MKIARFVLKIVGASLALAGFVCLIIGYWDKFADCFFSCKDKAVDAACKLKPRPAEYDDFDDVD